MPTGYTDKVRTGEITEFSDFALRCARAFGALIEMRDMSLDAKLPVTIEPSSYHRRELFKAQQHLAEVKDWTDEQALAHQDAAIEAACDELAEFITEREQTEARYRAMLRQVKEWNPPSPDHEAMKTFMVDQLEQSIQFDCGDLSWYTIPERKSADAYKAEHVRRALDEVNYHTRHWLEDCERAASRTQWLNLLRESL